MWLDDVRPAPPGWHRVYDVDQAKHLLLSGAVEECSLDHDLGLGVPNGTDLVNWMAEHDVWPPVRPCVHSANPVGAERMNGIIDRYGPYPKNSMPARRRPQQPSWSRTGSW